MPLRDMWLPNLVRRSCAVGLGFLFVLCLLGLPARGAIGPKAIMCSPLNAWVLRNAGTTSNFHDVAFVNGMFVAVGTSTDITCSANGVNWTNRVLSGVPALSSPGGAFGSIAYGNNIFLVTGTRNYNAVSSNGLAWTSGPWAGLLSSVAFGDRWFCFPTTNGSIFMYTNGNLTTPVVTNILNTSWFCAAYGNRRFVCVGRDGSTMVSTNATNWVRSFAGVTNINRLTFGLGMFVGVGTNGTIFTSTDGLVWTHRVSHSAANLTAVTFGDGRFVAVSDSSPNSQDRLVNSRDGVNWCAYPMPTNAAWRAIAYGSNSFVIVGADGTVMQSLSQSMIVSPPQNQIVCAEEAVTLSVDVASSLPVRYQWQFNGTNINGATNPVFTLAKVFPEDAGPYRVTVTDDRVPITSTGSVQVNLCRGVERWTVQKPAGYQSNVLTSIACNGDTLVAVGNVGTIIRSTDGVTWAAVNPVTNAPLNAVAFGVGKFVAVGTRGVIVSSSDGASWALRNSGTNGNLRGITFAGGKFVVTGGNTYVLTSTDGVTWVSHSTGTNRAFAAIAHLNGLFVGVGSGGMILTSPDAINWAPVESGTALNLFRIAAGNSAVVAVGEHVILRSVNGSEWTLQATPVSSIWRSICFAHGQFVVAGDPGLILVSRDGIAWSAYDSRIGNLVNAIAGCGDFFYSAFNDGLVSQSAFAGFPRLRAEVRPPLFTLGMVAEIGVPMRLQTRDDLSAPWTDVFAFTNARTTSTLLNTAITNDTRRFYQIAWP